MEFERLYSISELSDMFDVSSRTIRYYEEIGLLSSETRDSNSQQRYYTHSGRRRLKLILRGKKLGFSLQEIAEMLDLYESNPDGEHEKQRILEFADRKLQELQEKIDELMMLRADILAHKEKLLGNDGS